jgi:hypothetical protein
VADISRACEQGFALEINGQAGEHGDDGEEQATGVRGFRFADEAFAFQQHEDGGRFVGAAAGDAVGIRFGSGAVPSRSLGDVQHDGVAGALQLICQVSPLRPDPPGDVIRQTPKLRAVVEDVEPLEPESFHAPNMTSRPGHPHGGMGRP